MGPERMDTEIIAVSRYVCSRLLLSGRRIVSAVAYRIEIKLALFARSRNPRSSRESSLLSFACNTEARDGN